MEPVTLDQLLKTKYPKIPMLLGQGILPERGRLFIYGRYGSWKSMTALDLGMALTTGRKWMDLIDTQPDGVDVLYAQTEVPQPLLQDRAKVMAQNYSAKIKATSNGIWAPREHLFLWTEHFLKLDDAKGYSAMLKHVEKYRPRVVIIDPLYKLMSGDMLKVDVATPFLDRLDELMARTNIALVVIAHPRKGVPDETGADDLLGSSLFADWADTVMRATRTGGGSEWDNVRMDFLKTRHATKMMEPLEVTINRRSLIISAVATGISIAAPKGKK